MLALPVAGQVGLGEKLSQQHAVRHVLEDRPLRRAVLKANTVTNLKEARTLVRKETGTTV